MQYTAPATIAPDLPVFTTVDGGRRRLDLVIDMGRQYTAKDLVIKVNLTFAIVYKCIFKQRITDWIYSLASV